ncbi:hypothetical protein GCM10020255_027180 [Rhodococcus baikonurensis]
MTASTAAAADLLTRADRALDDLVGRESIKSAVHKICRTAEHPAPGVAQPGHLVFTGPLGTGKSAVAQIIADIYAGTGIITSPTVHSVSDRDLAGRYWDNPSRNSTRPSTVHSAASSTSTKPAASASAPPASSIPAAQTSSRRCSTPWTPTQGT